MYGNRSDIDRLRARRDELVNMIERTRARIEAAEAAMERAEEFKEDLRGRVWVQEIAPGLGEITVDCEGYLKDVRLNADSVWQSDVGQLGSRILAALQAAEARINEQRQEGLKQIFKHVTMD